MDAKSTADALPIASPEAHTGHTRWWVAAGHIFATFMGPGLLVMPYIMSRLGWVAGPIALAVMFALTLWTSSMNAQCYEVDGRRNRRYDLAALHLLGKRHAGFLATSQHVNLALANVGFQIGAADSVRYIALAACAARGCNEAGCWVSPALATVVVGAAQLLLSQMRDLQTARWTSGVGSLASLGYAVIVFGLAASQVGNRLGSVTPGYTDVLSVKVFSAFNALGAVAFGLNVPIITFEITDTLRQPPAAAVSMQKSLALGLGSCFVLFLATGVLGYSALGDAIGENTVLSFESTAPGWTIIAGSVMVMLNMVSAYQVCAQPSFAAAEAAMGSSLDRCAGGRSNAALAPWARLLLSLAFRSCYVAFTTVIAISIPFFALILGLVGATTFYQTGVLYPILLHRKAYPPRRRGVGALMSTVLVLGAGVALIALIGSIALIVQNATELSTGFG